MPGVAYSTEAQKSHSADRREFIFKVRLRVLARHQLFFTRRCICSFSSGFNQTLSVPPSFTPREVGTVAERQHQAVSAARCERVSLAMEFKFAKFIFSGAPLLQQKPGRRVRAGRPITVLAVFRFSQGVRIQCWPQVRAAAAAVLQLLGKHRFCCTI